MLIPQQDLHLPGVALSNHLATQVIEDFLRMPEGGSIILINEGSNFPDNVYSSGIDNHFQGLQRSKKGMKFLATGGTVKTKEGHLFIKDIVSHTWRIPQQDRIKRIMDYETGPIGNNSLLDDTPPDDLNIHAYEIEKGPYWHAGGFSMLDRIMVVPLERKDKIPGGTSKNSKILFIDVDKPASPKRNIREITRTGEMAGATSVTQLSNGRFLCAVWTDSDSLGHRFDFYLSQTDDVFSDYDVKGTVKGSSIQVINNDKPLFQNINFIKESSGRLFLIGFSNTDFRPSFGKNYGYLMEVFTDNLFSSNPAIAIQTPIIQYLHKKYFGKAHTYCDFSASTGAHITADGTLLVYGGHHYRRAGLLKLSEFAPRVKDYPTKIKNIQDSVIELYDNEFFMSRCLKIYGTDHSSIKNFFDISVSGGHFDNSISSIRFIIPEGHTYSLFQLPDYQKRPTRKPLLLTGTGRVVEWPQLGNDNGVASSSKFTA